MPDASVHRWSDLPADRPMDLIERRRIVGERLMVSRVSLTRGFRVPTHSHANEQLAILLSGRMRFTLHEGTGDERVEVLEAGESLMLPGGVPHAAEALEDTVILDVFAPPSETTGVDMHGA